MMSRRKLLLDNGEGCDAENFFEAGVPLHQFIVESGRAALIKGE
jgi:hypothetical protein